MELLMMKKFSSNSLNTLNDEQKWALSELHIPADSAPDTMRTSLLKRLREEDFVLYKTTEHAIRLLLVQEGGQWPVVARRSFLEFEEQRLRELVEEFAESFFNTPCAERCQIWTDLLKACDFSPALKIRLQGLQPGLDIEPELSSDVPYLESLVELVLEAFTLRPARRQVLLMDQEGQIQIDAVGWQRAARILQKDHTELSELIPEFIQRLSTFKQRTNRVTRNLNKRQKRYKASVEGSSISWIIATCAVVVASIAFGWFSADSKQKVTNVPSIKFGKVPEYNKELLYKFENSLEDRILKNRLPVTSAPLTKAMIEHEMAKHAEKAKVWRSAAAQYAIAYELFKKIEKEGTPSRNIIRLELVKLCRDYGDFLTSQGYSKDAQRIYKHGIDIARLLLNENPDKPKTQSALGMMLHGQAILLQKEGQFQDSIPLLIEAIEHQRTAIKSSPEEEMFRDNLENHYLPMINAYVSLDELDLARSAANDWYKLCGDDFERLYEVARIFAVQSNIQIILKEMGTGNESIRLALSELATETLQAAAKVGFRDLERLRTDSVWQFINIPWESFPPMKTDSAKSPVEEKQP
jgi:tetratricopeptide (TPR) repeat protein